MPVRRSHQARYNTVATSDEAVGTHDSHQASSASSAEGQSRPSSDAPTDTNINSTNNSTSSGSYSSVPDAEQEIELETVPKIVNPFSVTILDFTHTKFTVSGLERSATVAQLKQTKADYRLFVRSHRRQ